MLTPGRALSKGPPRRPVLLAERHVAGVEATDVAIGQLDEQGAAVVDAGRFADHWSLAGLHADAAVQQVVALAKLTQRALEAVGQAVEVASSRA